LRLRSQPPIASRQGGSYQPRHLELDLGRPAGSGVGVVFQI